MNGNLGKPRKRNSKKNRAVFAGAGFNFLT
jgi:hypothetical protein